MNVDFHDLAVEEIGAARIWYEERNPSAAARLLREIEGALDRAARMPEACPLFAEGYRWIKVRRFPYILVFELPSPEILKVIAVAHTSRRPGYWLDRT